MTCLTRARFDPQVSTLSTSMGMELEGRGGDESALGSGLLDFHYPHPYEVEVRAFHYMPAQVSWLIFNVFHASCCGRSQHSSTSFFLSLERVSFRSKLFLCSFVSTRVYVQQYER